jgi:alpha-tubulin suppressor-like RCC1 family protein
MNAHNLAVCWGQNLIRPETLSPTTLAHTSNVNKITEAMIQHVEEIFSDFTDLETEVSQMFSKNKKGTFDIFGVKSGDKFSPSECAMKLVDGIIMLKYSRRRATNHFRLFKMTHNLEYLVWGSHKKDVYGSSISIRDIKVMTCGVDTLLKLDDGKLAQYAISLRYGRKSNLDLVCKTQEEHFIVSQALAYCIMEAKSKFSTRPSKASSIHAPVTAIVDITKELQSEAAKLGDLYTWGATLGKAKYIPSIINKLVNVDIIEFAVGSNAYAAINSNGQLYTWGGGKSSDLLGHRTADTVQSPQLVTALANTKVTRVAMGAKHCLILDYNGYVYACGDNKYGQLGLTHVSTTNQPTKITQDDRFIDIFCGYSHSGLLTTEGDLLLFGRGDKDQLGYTTAELSNATPKRLELGWERVVSCVMGKMHTMILLDDGSVRSFGGAGFGQLGLGTEDLSQRAEPKEIAFFRENNVNVIQLAAGGRSSGCVTHDGSVYIWGDISSTGLVSYGCFQFVPLKLTLDGPGSKLCLGEDHALVLLQNGEVLSFGNNEGGALGRGENVPNTKAPVSMLVDKKIRAIACGGRSSACICAHEWTNPAVVTNCAGCKQPFSKFRQKYNCCNCGGIFCDKCSKKKAVLLRFGHVDPVRVCDECHKAQLY